MHRTRRIAAAILATIALAVTAVGLTPNPASAATNDYLTFEIGADWTGPECTVSLELSNTPFGYAYVKSWNFGYGTGGCSDGQDWYDDPKINVQRFRVYLQNWQGNEYYSAWISPSSPYNGIDQYIEVVSSVQGSVAYRACVEAQYWSYNAQAWVYALGGNLYNHCLYA